MENMQLPEQAAFEIIDYAHYIYPLLELPVFV